MNTYNPRDPQDILTRPMWAEARSEGRAGIEAVACVIVTRAHYPGWRGRDVLGVFLAPSQFSC